MHKEVYAKLCISHPEVSRLEINRQEITFVPLEEPSIYLDLSIAWRKDRYLSHASKELIRFASKKLGVK